MKAIVYTRSGGPEVLVLADRPLPEPGPGQVRVKVHVSGVNPTDWKARQSRAPADGTAQVPNQDGAGVVDAVGPGVDPARVGRRVWLWEAAYQRVDGTAQEYTVLPDRQAVDLPDEASFDLGASLGIPALTAHRALTVAPDGPRRLGPGALAGRTVLVAGGAGAVGNAAIQLALWSGAQVVATVSSKLKEVLATAAGAHHVVNYREADAAAAIRALVPAGVDLVVEVAAAANRELDLAVLGPGGVVAFYAGDAADEVAVPVIGAMFGNFGWFGILVYTVSGTAKGNAVADVGATVAAGGFRVGERAGLALHRFPLAQTAQAHAAVAEGAVGKVLIDVVEPEQPING